MTRVFLLVLACIGLVSSSCESGISAPAAGPVVTTWRTVTAFNGLEVSSAMEVIVKEGATDSILLEVSEGYVRYIRTEVVDGTLRVYVEDEVELDNLEANTVTIWVPTLKGIAASGASTVRVQDTLRSSDLILIASGASTMQLTALSSRIDVMYSGASALDIAGVTDRFGPKPVSGASVIQAYDLTASRTDAVLSGASVLETTTSDTLQVVASGASVVRYKGRPEISSSLSGGAILEDKN